MGERLVRCWWCWWVNLHTRVSRRLSREVLSCLEAPQAGFGRIIAECLKFRKLDLAFPLFKYYNQQLSPSLFLSLDRKNKTLTSSVAFCRVACSTSSVFTLSCSLCCFAFSRVASRFSAALFSSAVAASNAARALAKIADCFCSAPTALVWRARARDSSCNAKVNVRG